MPKKNIKPRMIRMPKMPMPPPRPAPPGKLMPPPPGIGKPKPPPPSSRRSSIFSLSLSPRHRIFRPPRHASAGLPERPEHCAWPAPAHKLNSVPLEGREKAPNDQPRGVRRNPQILVVKSEIDKKASQNCHRHKAFYRRPVVFCLGGSAFCVMRTSLGNPRAGALLFWAPPLSAAERRHTTLAKRSDVT